MSFVNRILYSEQVLDLQSQRMAKQMRSQPLDVRMRVDHSVVFPAPKVEVHCWLGLIIQTSASANAAPIGHISSERNADFRGTASREPFHGKPIIQASKPLANDRFHNVQYPAGHRTARHRRDTDLGTTRPWHDGVNAVAITSEAGFRVLGVAGCTEHHRRFMRNGR